MKLYSHPCTKAIPVCVKEREMSRKDCIKKRKLPDSEISTSLMLESEKKFKRCYISIC